VKPGLTLGEIVHDKNNKIGALGNVKKTQKKPALRDIVNNGFAALLGQLPQ